MTPTKNSHPSVLELDTYFASRGGGRDASVAAHVAGCAACTAYLERLTSFAPIVSPPEERAEAAFAARPRALGGMAAAAAGLALAAGAALIVRTAHHGDEAAYVAAKGAPAVEVWVEGDAGLRRWSEADVLRAGERLGFRVACEDFREVAVASMADAPTVLVHARCESVPFSLPKSLLVDDAPNDETLAVVFSDARLDDAALRAALVGSGAGRPFVVQLRMRRVPPR
jgi:hypothetical protein